MAVQKIKVLQSSWSGRRPVTAEIAGSSPARTAHCGVEQLVARWAHNPKVAGSNPAPATNKLFEIFVKSSMKSIIGPGHKSV